MLTGIMGAMIGVSGLGPGKWVDKPSEVYEGMELALGTGIAALCYVAFRVGQAYEKERMARYIAFMMQEGLGVIEIFKKLDREINKSKEKVHEEHNF